MTRDLLPGAGRADEARVAPAPRVDRHPRSGFPLLMGIACGVLLAPLLFVENEVPERGALAGAGAGASGERLPSRLDPSAQGDASPSDRTAVGGPSPGVAGPGATDVGMAPTSGPGAGIPSEAVTGPSPAQEDEEDAAVRGVSDELVRVGVALPDLGAFAVVDEFDLGDTRGHFEAILDGWFHDGLVPVHGRDVEFVYREFDIVGDEDVATCNAFAKDDEVFAVIGLRSYTDGVECLASRFEMPVVTLEAASRQTHDRLYPYVFTLMASSERIAENFVHWAHEGGMLEDKRIGIYYERPDAVATNAAVKAELGRLGYTVAAEASTDSKTGGPEDQVAVQQFRSEEVDLALLLVTALPAASFMEQAESQLYRPGYIATDYADHTSDAASSVFPESQYGGTIGTSMTRVGEIRADGGLAPRGEACVANYERYSGRTIDRSSPESAELVAMLQGCDEAEVVLAGLLGAGRALDRGSFIRGIEATERMSGASHGVYEFTDRKHHGAEVQRDVQWLAECSCWTALTPFGALWPR